MTTFDKAQAYDLNDLNFGWRGKYRFLKEDPASGLIHIENLGTTAKQFVSPHRLRPSTCQQFRLASRR